MGEVILFHGSRHSGRTWRQLRALPDGSIFVVPNEKFASYCRGLLQKMGRQPRAIQFATPDNFLRFKGGRAAAVDVDHAYHQVTRGRLRAQEAVDFVHLCAVV